MGEINQDKVDRSLMSAKDRALIAEADHVIRKADALLAAMRAFYKEQGWEINEMSKVD